MNFISSIDLKKWFTESRNKIYDEKKFIALAIGIFIICLFLGYFYFDDSQLIKESLKRLYEKDRSDDYLVYVSGLFLQNTAVLYLSIRLGILLGLFPAVVEILLGLQVGWLFSNVDATYRLKLFLMLVPHGIFEIPAIFIACGIGYSRCKLLFVHNYDRAAKENIREIHKLFITIVVPLLLLAAIIEGIPLIAV